MCGTGEVAAPAARHEAPPGRNLAERGKCFAKHDRCRLDFEPVGDERNPITSLCSGPFIVAAV